MAANIIIMAEEQTVCVACN